MSVFTSVLHASNACPDRFQCYLQARLVKKFAALELGLDEDMLSYRLRQLTLLLPDMSEFVLQHHDATDEGARNF